MYHDDDWSYEDRQITPVFPPFRALLGRDRLRRYDLVAQLARAFRLPAGAERYPVVEMFLLEVHLRAADRYAENELRIAGPTVRGAREVVKEAVALCDPYDMLTLLEVLDAGDCWVSGRVGELATPMKKVFVKQFHPRAEAVLRKALRETRRMEQAA